MTTHEDKTYEENCTPDKLQKTPTKTRSPIKCIENLTPKKGSVRKAESSPQDLFKTPPRKPKKRARSSSPPVNTPPHRKIDVGPSTRIGPPDSFEDGVGLEENLEEDSDEETKEFHSPTKRRRFLIPRLDDKALDQVTSEMIGIAAPPHLIELIPKSLLMNKNCVEAAFDWLLDHWDTPDEDRNILKESKLEKLYSSDQAELRDRHSFTEFEIDINGSMTITRIADTR